MKTKNKDNITSKSTKTDTYGIGDDTSKIYTKHEILLQVVPSIKKLLEVRYDISTQLNILYSSGNGKISFSYETYVSFLNKYMHKEYKEYKKYKKSCDRLNKEICDSIKPQY